MSNENSINSIGYELTPPAGLDDAGLAAFRRGIEKAEFFAIVRQSAEIVTQVEVTAEEPVLPHEPAKLGAHAVAGLRVFDEARTRISS
ncbi:MAG: hypothetical protein JWO47_431 [Candidatus Saccharibacteria bacterium]|nr:hypothetical protein [Candidatus Saccharibacteria bacterium]